ncbi:four helix bundle protein [Coleofasciculus sp. H7-2]|uniref:four helix bundle protein n=1 Tax=Coleofasciculus sp. H7-2 TaxID=3351545 RepID=UPI00366C2921
MRLCQHLDEKPGVRRTLSNQLLRSGTSIGANVQEARAGQSRADFLSKMAIALKEARETHYWLRLLIVTEVLSQAALLPLQTEVEELTRIIGPIIVSTQKSNP